MRPRGATPSPPTPTLGRGRARRVWLGFTQCRPFVRAFGLVLAFGLFASVAPDVAAQDLVPGGWTEIGLGDVAHHAALDRGPAGDGKGRLDFDLPEATLDKDKKKVVKLKK